MKTNLPTAICLINHFFECLSGFYKIKYANFNVCFEDLSETSEEGLTSVCAVSSRGCMCGFSLIKYANFYVSFEGLPETEQRFVTIVYLIVSFLKNSVLITYLIKLHSFKKLIHDNLALLCSTFLIKAAGTRM